MAPVKETSEIKRLRGELENLKSFEEKALSDIKQTLGVLLARRIVFTLPEERQLEELFEKEEEAANKFEEAVDTWVLYRKIAKSVGWQLEKHLSSQGVTPH